MRAPGPCESIRPQIRGLRPAWRSRGVTDEPWRRRPACWAQALIRSHYPYLTESVVAALHVRRAGWLSAQQMGMYLLERARDLGTTFRSGHVEAVRLSATTASMASTLDPRRKDRLRHIRKCGGTILQEGRRPVRHWTFPSTPSCTSSWLSKTLGASSTAAPLCSSGTIQICLPWQAGGAGDAPSRSRDTLADGALAGRCAHASGRWRRQQAPL